MRITFLLPILWLAPVISAAAQTFIPLPAANNSVRRSLPMRLTAFALTCLIASFTTAYAEQLRAPRVEMEVLGSFPGAQWTVPVAINNRRQVAGTATVEGVWVAFIWTRDRGFEQIATNAVAFDINDRGQVVGFWVTCPGDCPTHGFIWSAKDGFRDLGPEIFPAAINNRGDVAGSCVTDNHLEPCTLRGGRLTLADCEGNCIGGEGTGINARGDAAGYLEYANTTTDAFVFHRNGTQIPLSPGVAWDLNDSGIVVGVTDTGTAAVWTRGGMLTLDRPGTSVAKGINARGSVVGIGDDRSRAFFWEPRSGAFVFLSDERSEASDVNDRGDIVGWNGFFARDAVIWRISR
jgi:uncharacterized membrane protein